MVCCNCGRDIQDSSKFCKYCGHGISVQEKIESMAATNSSETHCDEKEGLYGIYSTIPTGRTGETVGRVIGVGILIAIVIVCLVIIPASKKECSYCGKTFYGAAYYDAYDWESIMCEDCAKKYYAGFDYKNFKK